MNSREYIHYRVVNILQLSLGLMAEIIVLWLLPISNTWKIWLSAIAVISNSFLLVLFYKSSITVTTESILFKFGVGLINIPFEIAEIERCVPLDTPRINSKGLLKKFLDWVNRITHTHAIELQFIGKDSVTQLETSCHYEVANEIHKVLEAKKTL